MFLGILAAVAGVRALILWNPFGLNQGAEVTYRVLFPDSFRFSRADACERTRRVLVSRAFGTGVDAEGRIEGSDRVVLRVLLERREQLDEILPILGRHAGFGLYPAAPRDVQAQFNRDGVVPEGYRSMENVQPDQRQIGGEYAVWDVERILVATEAVVNAGHVWSARAESQNWGMGPVWVTSFQLDMEGSKRFDAAAGELYRRAPRGMIAIVMDGRIHSTPAVQAEAFGGTGQVSGAASREEAEALSIVLRSGELPAPIGRVRAGKPEPGEPEGIEWFGFDEGAGP